MKKMNITTLTICAFLTVGMISSCNTPAKEVESAQDEAEIANDELDKANDQYLQELENYRIETAILLAQNEKAIADYKAKNATKIDNDDTVADLERKNSELKKRLDDYKPEDKSNWEKFKEEFSHDMSELGQAFKSIGKNDVK